MSSKIDLDKGRTIVFIGDSITDAGRLEPAYQPFGYGYVHFVANMLLAKYPELNLNIINTGVHGDTIRSLKARWEKDCISHRPAVVSILIGVNDLWRQHAEPERLVEAVYPREYEFTHQADTQVLSNFVFSTICCTIPDHFSCILWYRYFRTEASK